MLVRFFRIGIWGMIWVVLIMVLSFFMYLGMV